MYNSFSVKSFNGGITDNVKISYLDTANKMENFDILDDGSIVSRQGYGLYSFDVPQVPTSNKINLFFTINKNEFLISGRQIYHYTKTSIEQIVGDTGNHAFDEGNYIYDPNNPIELVLHNDSAIWKNQVFAVNDIDSKPIKIFHNDTGWHTLTAGLPAYNTDPTFSPAPTSGLISYLYALFFVRTYIVDGVTFIDQSEPHLIQYTTNTAIDASNPVDISNFQSIVNGAKYSYGLSDIEIKVFRTINGGEEFYYVNSTPMLTPTTITDNIADDDLQLNEPAYFNGGVKYNSEPPKAKFIENVNSTMFYADGYTVHHSIPGDPDSVPGDFYLEFNDYITGLSSINKKPIVFTKDAVYRLDGYVNSLGIGNISISVIDSTIGCIGYQTIVKSPSGIYFASATGFCFTDGYRVVKISEKFNQTYNELTSSAEKALEIVGRYDFINRKVYWASQVSKNAMANDGMFIFYEKYGVKREGVFTTYKNIHAASMHINHDNIIIFGDLGGYIYAFDSQRRSDIVKNTIKPAEEWNNAAIIYNYISCELDFGSRENRKWVAKLDTRCRNVSNISLQPSLSTDGMQEFKKTGIIRVRTQLSWNEPFREWETDPELNIWENNRDYNHIRFVPRGNLRAYTKQVKFTNAFIDIQKSDELAKVAVSLEKITGIQKFNQPVKLLPSAIYHDANNDEYLFLHTSAGSLYYIKDNSLNTVVSPISGPLYGIFYLNGDFIVIGKEGINTNISYTDELIDTFSTWDTQTIGTEQINALDYMNGLYVATSISGSVYTSSDKINWTHAFTASESITAIANNGTYFMVVGANGYAAFSSDGATWHTLNTGFTNKLNTIVAVSGTFVMAGDSGKIVYTSNMQDVDVSDSGTTDNINKLIYEDIIIYVTNKGNYGFSANIEAFNTGLTSPLLLNQDVNGLYSFKNKIYIYSLYKGFHSVATLETIRNIELNTTDYWFNNDYIDYYISFENDNYEKNYRISDYLSPQELQIIDTVDEVEYTSFSDNYPDGYKWIVRGIPKNEKINIISYSLYFAMFGESFDPMSANTATENEQ